LWIPNRNALFINIAASYAEYYGARIIVTGFNREEAQDFPDNSVHFLRAVNQSLKLSTLNRVEVRSYVLKYTKREIYRLGMKLKAPLELVYSCYLGGKSMCGKCASCKRLVEAKKQ
jgi:7-cyano-7-deazaguanine synthase